ncbi:MAG TPA: hypothetical protein VK186_06605, partial [Candidatus Deferrimicrobium sp.]|nr:hypothetical protein [Candidatus Deferrimicrobium sp.]
SERARIYPNAREFFQTRSDLEKRARCFANYWRRRDKSVGVMTKVHAVLVPARPGYDKLPKL